MNDVLEKKLREVGKAYSRAKFKRPPVLVIDSADIVYKEDPQLLSRIQGFAKTAADNDVMRVVGLCHFRDLRHHDAPGRLA